MFCNGSFVRFHPRTLMRRDHQEKRRGFFRYRRLMHPVDPRNWNHFYDVYVCDTCGRREEVEVFDDQIEDWLWYGY